MKKRICSMVLCFLMIAVNCAIPVSADTTTVTAQIQALPEAAAVTESTAELRGAIEDIDEALAAENLTSADFAAEVWSKWEAVKAKNAYYLPSYEMVDISGVVDSPAFVSEHGQAKTTGRTMSDYFSYYTLSNNNTVWKETVALWRERINAKVGADQIVYSDTGVPFSFPAAQNKAIGLNGSSMTKTVAMNTSKNYRSIAFAAATGNRESTFSVDLIYEDGYVERQSFTLPEGWTASADVGNLIAGVNALWSGQDAATYTNGSAKCPISWFEMPVDVNRKLSSVNFLDYNNTADYKVLSLTACTAMSQAETDALAVSGRIYETVDLSGAANSIVYVDSTNLDKSSMTLTNNDLFDYASYTQHFAISKDGINALAGGDELIHSKQNVPYSFPASQYKAIGLKAGVSDSVSAEVDKTCYGISFITATAVWKDASAMCRIHYTDGSYIDKSFTAKDGWGTGQSNQESIFAGANIFAGTSTLALPDAAGRQFGMYEVSLDTDETRPVDRIEFFANGSNYKVLAITALTDISQQDKNQLAYHKGNDLYVTMSDSLCNARLFTDENNLNKPEMNLTPADFIAYDSGNPNVIALNRAGVTERCNQEGIILAKDGTGYKLPAEQYKGISVTSDLSAGVPMEQKIYDKISFAAATVSATGENLTKVAIYYSDGTSESKSVTLQTGYAGASIDNEICKAPCYMSWNANTPFAVTPGGTSFTLGSYSVTPDTSKQVSEIAFSYAGTGGQFMVAAITATEASLYSKAHAADNITIENAAANKALILEAYNAASSAVERGWDNWDSFGHLAALKNEVDDGYVLSTELLTAPGSEAGKTNITLIISTTESEPVAGRCFVAVYNNGAVKSLARVYLYDISPSVAEASYIMDEIAIGEDEIAKGFLWDANLKPIGEFISIPTE
ncbi:MAG: hypothetical protein J6N52_14230 [Clostridia bacterium]|nr:hypothetical protein [Clostridia bacterium]